MAAPTDTYETNNSYQTLEDDADDWMFSSINE